MVIISNATIVRYLPTPKATSRSVTSSRTLGISSSPYYIALGNGSWPRIKRLVVPMS